MNTYVWETGNVLIVAVAEDAEKARWLVLTENGYDYSTDVKEALAYPPEVVGDKPRCIVRMDEI